MNLARSPHHVRLTGGPIGSDVRLELDGRQVQATGVTISVDPAGWAQVTVELDAQLTVEVEGAVALSARADFPEVPSADSRRMVQQVAADARCSAFFSDRSIPYEQQRELQHLMQRIALLDAAGFTTLEVLLPFHYAMPAAADDATPRTCWGYPARLADVEVPTAVAEGV